MTDPVVREREVPSLWRRLAAGAVDCLIAGVPTAVAILTGLLDVSRWTPTGDLPAFEHVATTLHATRAWTTTQWFVAWLPLCLLHAGVGVARVPSPGAWLAGLRVVGPDGHAPSSLRGLARGVAYATWPATLLLAPLFVAVLPSQRGLHDVLSGTWVVRNPAAAHRRSRRRAGAMASTTSRPRPALPPRPEDRVESDGDGGVDGPERG